MAQGMYNYFGDVGPQRPQFDYSKTQYGVEGAEKSAAGISAGQNAAREQEAQTAAAPGLLTAENKQSRFNSVFPMIQGALGNGGFGAAGFGSGAFGAGNSSPGQIGTPPPITAGPVWNQNQIQQQINGQTAQNDAATAGQVKGINASTAGRGFGSNSPLAQALGVAAQGQNRATNTQNAQQTQWNAAQGNAQQLLAGQNAQQAQFSDINNQDIERHKVIAGQQSALLAALGSLTN